MGYKFEDKYVHFRWSDELIGKMVFLADDIGELEGLESWLVLTQCSDSGAVESPFHSFYDGEDYQFCYYDPRYELKIAWEAGAEIEYKGVNDGNWHKAELSPYMYKDNVELRIKPKAEEQPVVEVGTRLQNRHLSLWLAKGYGEFRYVADLNVFTDYCYNNNEEHATVADNILVRKWEDTEWYEPTLEYCKEVLSWI